MSIPVLKFDPPLPCATIIADIDDEIMLCGNSADVATATPSNEVEGGWVIVPMCKSCAKRMSKVTVLKYTPVASRRIIT